MQVLIKSNLMHPKHSHSLKFSFYDSLVAGKANIFQFLAGLCQNYAWAHLSCGNVIFTIITWAKEKVVLNNGGKCDIF